MTHRKRPDGADPTSVPAARMARPGILVILLTAGYLLFPGILICANRI